IYEFEVSSSAASGASPPTPAPDPAPAPSPVPTNLAIGARATASASSVWDATYSAATATDANATITRWNAAGATCVGQWLQVDFGSAQAFDSTTIKEALDRITGYKIQYFNGVAWVDAVSHGTTIGMSKTDTFTPITASKVRLYVTSTVSRGGDTSP